MRILAMMLCFLCLVGCTRYPEDLQSLQRDPMADAAFANAELVRSSAKEAETLTGKPSPAAISNVYRPIAGTIAQLQEAAIKLAVANGWSLDAPRDDVVTGHKNVESGGAQISIYPIDEQGEQALLVRLEHDWDHPTT